MNENIKLKNIFFEEASELLSNTETNLISLESNPNNKKIINQIFRDIHTLKGSGSLFDFKNINQLTHNLEDLLEAIQDKKVVKLNEPIDILFKSVDLLKLLIETEKQNKADSDQDMLTEELIGLIKKLTEDTKKLRKPKNSAKSTPIGELLIDNGIIKEEDLEKALDKQKSLRLSSQTSVRVKAEKLDSLIDLVGELVISHSLLTQYPAIKRIDDQQLIANISQLGKAINDLQDQIMSLRMIPISHSFNRMKRLVRDTSVKLEKEVQISISGEETEIDKNVVDDLNEILVHLIRNSIDHGIELPAERVATGKKPVGQVELNAFPRGGNIIIEIKDDGCGLPKQKIINKALKRGLNITIENEAWLYQLIFEPGFSTAEQVTSISGRGVGLDVVKKKLEEIRGKIEVYSEEGKGTTFTITLQPTLAIIDGMVFRVGSERMIVPTLSIEESLRPSKEQIITIKDSGEAVMVRGKVYPLIRLHQIFSINSGSQTKPWEALVMLANSQGRQFTILIDELIGQQQVVIKSLGERFKKLKAISGGAILGDGSVGLILDLDGLMDCVVESPELRR